MSIRTWAQVRIVFAYPDGIPDAKAKVDTWTLAQCQAYMDNQSKLHRFLVGVDMALGQWGVSTASGQDATISSRTAMDCRNPVTAGTWALLLGTFLEWLDPGHLEAAMLADYCRARLELGK
jgi:hypothetical protein